MITRLKWLCAAGAVAMAAPLANAAVPTGPAQNLTPKNTYTKVAPRISADGNLVVYTDYTGAVDGSNTSRNIAYKKRGDADFLLAKWQMWEKQDEWAVAGPNNTIWFQSFSQPNGRTDIWKYDVNTGQSTQMTNHVAYDAFPAISPDGTKMAFLSQRDTAWYQMYLMDATKPENTTDNIPKAVITFPAATGVTLGRMSFTPDSKQIVFLYKTAAMPRAEVYIGDAADLDNDNTLDNLRPLTDIGAVKTGGGVSEPGGVIGDRAYFTTNVGLDGTGKNHVYSVSISAGAPNADLWQVSASNANENYVSVGGDGMVVLAVSDVSRGAYAQYVDYYPMGGPDDAPGGASGILKVSPQGSNANYLVEAFNGTQKIAETTTDSSGAWAFTDLRPGGYFLRFSPGTGLPNISTVTRPVIVPPGGNAVVDVFSSYFSARRPFGVVPTIRPDGSVDIRFQPAAESAAGPGWSYVKFNVWRGPSADGPWTQIGEVSKDGPFYGFKDTNPGDLTKAFYSVTSVTTDGTDTLESWYADAGQAANNLIFNPGFELTDSTGKPLGYSFRQGTDGDATWDTTTSDTIFGSRSLVVTQGANRIDTFVDTSVAYNVPTPGAAESYIHGAYARFMEMPVAAGQTIRQAYSLTEPNAGATTWYDASYNSNATNSSSAALPTTPPTWLYQVNPITTLSPTTYTRVTLYGNQPAAGILPNVSRAVYDDFTFQVKRVGDTGVVWGRVHDSAGTPVAGVTVTDGEKTVLTDSSGVFAIRDSATGDHTVTLSYPGQPNIVRSIKNIGGYVFNEVLAFPNVIPVSYGGRVTLPNGQPAKGAKVTWVVGNLKTDPSEDIYTATTDANGRYTLNTASNPLNTSKKVWATAHLGGYKGAVVADRSIAGGGAGVVGFDLTLGARTPVIEVGRAAAPPTIDGVVNASEWAKSAEITSFVKFPTSNPYAPATRAYAMWDDQYLYVAMVADEPNPAGIKADQSGYESSATGVWGDDNFQVFLDPTRALGYGHGNEVWQLGFNLNTASIGITDGVLLVGPNPKALDTAPSLFSLEAKNSVNAAAQKWTVEVAIPWDELSYDSLDVSAPTEGAEWVGMFARYRSQDASNASTSSMGSKFSEPWNWNTLRFVNTVSPPTISAVDALKIAGGLKAATSKAGDVNNSGSITLEDALALLRSENGLN